LTDFMISSSITSIGSNALSNCSSLTAITVDSLNPAFSSSEGVLFDKTQTELIQCPGAKAGDFTIPPSVTSIQDGAFSGCGGLTSITIPNGITNIWGSTFSDCDGLTSLTIPGNVTSIGYEAFFGCAGLTSVIIPDGVTSIADEAFSDCTSLTEIMVDPLNDYYSSFDGVLFNETQTELIKYPGGKAGDYTIPDSVTAIESWAFSFCSGLTDFIPGSSVNSFGEYAFYGCAGLSSVTVPSSFTTVGTGAFFNCIGLNSVIISENIDRIQSYAFGDCSRLTGLYFKGDAAVLDLAVFDGDEHATVYYLPWTAGWAPTYGGLPTAEWPLSPADVDIDGYVNLTDFALLANKWLDINCEEINNWCQRTDFDHSEDVNANDLNMLAEYWLDVSIWTPSAADVDLNGQVDLYEFSVLASYWRQTDCDEFNNWCGWTDFDRSGSVEVPDLSLLADDWLYNTQP
jgi:hypothetical protein